MKATDCCQKRTAAWKTEKSRLRQHGVLRKRQSFLAFGRRSRRTFVHDLKDGVTTFTTDISRVSEIQMAEAADAVLDSFSQAIRREVRDGQYHPLAAFVAAESVRRKSVIHETRTSAHILMSRPPARGTAASRQHRGAQRRGGRGARWEQKNGADAG